jgi:hypothetical protein
MVPYCQEVGPSPQEQGVVQVGAPCSSSAAVAAAPCSSSAAVVGTSVLVDAFQRVPSWQQSCEEACSAMLPEKLGVALVCRQLVVHGPKQRAGWSCASLSSIHPWCWRRWLGGYASGQVWCMLHWCGCCRHRPRECYAKASFCTALMGLVGGGELACHLIVAAVVGSHCRPRRCIVTIHGGCWDCAAVAPRGWLGGGCCWMMSMQYCCIVLTCSCRVAIVEPCVLMDSWVAAYAAPKLAIDLQYETTNALLLLTTAIP